jgi:hypothetical protein
VFPPDGTPPSEIVRPSAPGTASPWPPGQLCPAHPSAARYPAVRQHPERDAAACNLYYAQKKTYSQIAEILGYADESGAKKAADRGLKAIQTRGNENLIAEVRARIAENREFVKARRDSPPMKVSPTGRPVYDDDGNPVYDDTVSLTAAAELRKLDQQEIDLLGLAAPRRSVTATIDASLDARLAVNEQLLQARLVELQAENERLRRQIAPANVLEAVVVDEGSDLAV